jgi:anaerobic selenocysteine-containing dehydrogenase
MCPILVTIEDGRPVKVEGNREAPLYGGYTCPKGRALPQQHNMPNRLLHCLKRMPDGSHVRISSDDLVEEVAERISRIIDESGPKAVAAYLGNSTVEQPVGTGMMLSFLNAIGSPMMFTPATIDQPGLVMSDALHGRWQGGRMHPDRCGTFLIIGGNPVVSKQHLPQNPAQRLKDMTSAGTQLIVIDPRRSETARRAAVHLQIIPGEDPTVLAGLIHLIFEGQGVDAAFLSANAQGVEQLREAVCDFTPDYVAARAGIDADDLRAAARILMQSRTGDTALGTGPSMATRGTLSSYLALCIQTLRGFWAREGDEVARPRVLLIPDPARAQPSPPRPAWGFGMRTVRGLQQTMAGMPLAALPELMLSKGEDRVRALFSHGGIVYTWPQASKTVEALRALDLFIMHDVQLTATSAMADYVIATKLQLEVPVMTQIVEATGLVHYGYPWTQPYAAYQPAALDPPEGADLLEAWQIYYRVAKKLGLTLELVDFVSSNPSPPKMDMAQEPTADDLYELFCEGSVVPLGRVKQYPDGALFEEARAVVQPRDPACEARLELADPVMMAQLRDVRTEDFRKRRRVDGDFPFQLIPHRMQNSFNSSPRPDGLVRTGYNPAFMNPRDMAELSLASGDRVRICSRNGSVVAFVEPDADLRQGVVAMTHGFGPRHGRIYDPRRDGANVNELTSWDDDSDPYHGMPRMSGMPVSVAALEQQQLVAAE